MDVPPRDATGASVLSETSIVTRNPFIKKQGSSATFVLLRSREIAAIT
ncbi:hypothetical protein CKAH01_11180 [Colletotrichum kahawae]|uniref:Uncharacterized protein n=1 Tax=Colletotrichum kahawae TaxID=34407 RepID=A0AAD9XVH8_COLKA|nr:hypothetical protein CKAH01_11180 [Colletotrichum kahawae]